MESTSRAEQQAVPLDDLMTQGFMTFKDRRGSNGTNPTTESPASSSLEDMDYQQDGSEGETDSEADDMEEEESDEGSYEDSGSESEEDSGSYSDDGEDVTGDSEDSSADWSSEEDDEYGDLMKEMPIALGRKGPAMAARPTPPRREATSLAMPAPLPIPATLDGSSSTRKNNHDDGGDAGPPLEGLAMLQNIRSELEKVGQMIVKNKQGEKFLQRAQILTSINYLSSNVPSCVLEDLGQEIRESIKRDEERKSRSNRTNNMMSMVNIGDVLDEDSASDLSDAHMAHETDEELSDEEADFFPDPRTPESTRKKFSMAGISPMRRMSRESSTLSASTHSANSFLSPTLRRGSRRNSERTYSFHSTASSASNSEESKFKDASLPIVTYFECALLFVDVSGFTRLSTLVDPENLSKVINSYFQLLVNKISDFNGDIQKFAGDALFAEFRASPTQPLHKCAELAAACASALVRECSDFPVETICSIMNTASDGIPSALNVHCGLSVGEMAGLHLGDNENRREYLYLGVPIKEAGTACDFAQLGEAAASRPFCELLQSTGAFRVDLSVDQEAFIIAERGNCRLSVNEAGILASQKRNARSRGITEHVDGLEPDSLIEYRRLMSLYVHPVQVMNDAAAANNFKPSSRASDQRKKDIQVEEAELRSVYVMFISPATVVEMTGDAKRDSATVEYVQSIMTLTSRELRRYNGHLRQFIMDDKGLVMIATFGLRGSTVPNMVGERALPATVALFNAFEQEMGIECKIGSTFGDVYCGAVGGKKRHEYAVMGPSVNLAARLMSHKANPGILVDDMVRKMASRSFAFNALDPIKAKGYTEMVHIFEPLSPIERGWGRIVPNFVGRSEEMSKLSFLASGFARRDVGDPKIVLVKAAPGMGKSTFLAHSIDRIRKNFLAARRGKRALAIAKHVGRETDSLRPFSTIASLLKRVLHFYQGSFDDRSQTSDKDSCYSSHVSTTNHSYSNCSNNGSTVMSESQFSDRLEAIFVDVCGPTEQWEYTRSLFENDEEKQKILFEEIDSTMVGTMAKAFRRCVQNVKVVMLALDDAHQCDEGSWMVLQELFETTDNLLIVATTSASNIGDLKIDPTFMENLGNRYSKVGRYHLMELSNLAKEEVSQMIMKSLALQRHEVTERMVDSVYSQSLGMPLVANELVTEIKEKVVAGDQLVEAGSSVNVADVFLHKIDTFDLNIRDVLNVSAILGQEFEFGEVVAAMAVARDAKEHDVEKECEEAFTRLVKEGILRKTNTIYSFNHDLWRSIPLGLMLTSRKRDIHRRIAQGLEAKLVPGGELSTELQAKLFNHWKETGNSTKAFAVAVVLCDLLEQDGDLSQIATVIEETLALWGWKPEIDDNRLAGLPKHFLRHVSCGELSHIVTMLVSLGKAYTRAGRQQEGVAWWENALRLMVASKTASKIRDRSIVFPAYNGLSTAIQQGHLVQDVYCRYEQAMLKKYIQETRLHGRLIHHIHALFLQMRLYGRQGDLDKAIAVHSIIKSIYKMDRHSQKLRKVYGQDSGALSFALCAFWETLEGEKKLGLKMCRSVLKDLLPRLDRNFSNMFNLMYPLTLTFKEAGYPTEAKAFFEKLIAIPYGSCPGDHPSHYLVKVFPTVSILCTIIKDKKISNGNLSEWANWVIQQEPASPQLQLELGRFGRCANSLTAEICALLAPHMAPNDPLRGQVLQKGTALITDAITFHRRYGLKCAIKPAKSIQNQLRKASKEG